MSLNRGLAMLSLPTPSPSPSPSDSNGDETDSQATLEMGNEHPAKRFKRALKAEQKRHQSPMLRRLIEGARAEVRAAQYEARNPSSSEWDCWSASKSGIGKVGLAPPAVDVNKEDDMPLRWREQFVDYFKPAFEECKWLRELRFGTLCSGTGAPRLALRLLGVPLHESFSADPKAGVMQFARNLSDMPQHHFRFVKDVGNKKGWCEVHEDFCCLEGTQDRVDLLTVGFPCQPFSTQRPERFQTGWQSHPLTVVMKETAEAIKILQPRMVVAENVPGFLRESRQAHHHWDALFP